MASMERTPSGVASTTVVVTVYFTVHVTGPAGCSRAHATVGSAGVGAAAIGAAGSSATGSASGTTFFVDDVAFFFGVVFFFGGMGCLARALRPPRLPEMGNLGKLKRNVGV